MSYLFGTNVEDIYHQRSSVTKNTYTTAAPITALSASAVQPVAKIPTAFWGDDPVHKGIHIHAMGTIANTAAATFIGQACLNQTAGTLLAAGSFTYWPVLAPTAALTSLWELHVWYTCIVGGPLMQLQYNADYSQSTVATGVVNTGTAPSPFNVKAQGILTFAAPGSQGDLFAELFGTWSASSASNTTTVQQFQVFGLN
jgi:hypothetical protein